MSREPFPAATGDEIAVIAMAGRFPGAGDVEQLWRNLRAGIESLSRFSAEELLAAGEDPALLRDPRYVPVHGMVEGVEEFDAGFFGYTGLEAEITDPQQRLLLECAWQALEQAGYDTERYRKPVGVYVGMSPSSYALGVLTDGAVLRSVGPEQALLLNDRDFCAGRISYKLGLTGPSLVVQTACSTSLVAVHLACQALLAGECELALAGGVAIKVPQRRGYLFQDGGIHSPDGHCRAFDARAQGTVTGDGIGIVVLKRLAEAQEDGEQVLAVIKATAINNDGTGKVGFTAPSIEGQCKVIRTAHALADVDVGTIGYVEAHGTATPLGDPIEFAALCEAFQQVRERRGSCAIGSLKTNIGHLDTASGIAGLIKTVLALYHREIPPSLHFQQPNPAIDLAASPFYVNTALVPWSAGGAPRRAGVSSFGIGGTNAHVVLEEAPAAQPSGPSRPWQLLPLSARSGPALERATGALAERLAAPPALELADVAYTLQVGRRRFAHRRVALVEDTRDAAAVLRSLAPQRVWSRAATATSRPVVFLFPGQGSQYVDMGRGLYEGEPVFRAGLDRCAELLAPELGTDLREVLYPSAERRPEAAAALRSSALTQPALFAVEHSLAGLWMDWGIQPEAMLGHSVGELVAACLAGVFGLEDGLRLSAVRGRLMQAMEPGAMVSVSLPEAQVSSRLADWPELSLAAVNGPCLCAVSGPPAAIAALAESLTHGGIGWRRLHVSHGFHSALMEPAVAPFVEVVRGVELHPPARPYISNVTGRWIDYHETTSPAYWGEHLRRTVRFADGVEELRREPERVFLEVGPGGTLTTLVRQQSAAAAGAVALRCLRHPQERAADLPHLLTALGRLWLAGAPVDWAAFSRREDRRRVPLPTYPFERQRYWHEPSARAGAASWPASPPAAAETAAAAVAAAETTAAAAGAAAAADHGRGHPRPDLETPYLPPRTPAEQLVARVWGELLGLAAVGIHDDFFELGGHSLLATRVVARLRQESGIEMPLRELLEDPTVAGSAARLEQQAGRREGAAEATAATAELPGIVPDRERRHEPFPLTDLQQAYWVGRRGELELGDVGTHAYWEVDFAGLDLARLDQALARLVAHHDMLRAVFQADGLQRILATVPRYRIAILDLRRLPAGSTGPGLVELRRRMSHQILPSDRWPLFEVRASLLPGGLVRLHVSLDFLIADVWSWQLICNEMAQLYLQPELPLAPLAISFRDHVLAELALTESPRHRRALAYWRDRLADLPGPPELPAPRRTTPGVLSRFSRRQARLDAEEWGRLKLRAGQHGLTPSAVLMAAFCEVLAAWSKTRRFVLHLTLFNRLPLHPEVPRLVGDFTSLILVEVDATGCDSFEVRARRLQQRLWQDLEHRSVSGVRVLRELAQLHGSRPPAAMPIVFTSTLHLEGAGPREGAQPLTAAAIRAALAGELVYGISQTPQVLLDHQVGEAAGALEFNWDAVDDAFPPGLLDEMFGAYRELLARLGAQIEVWREAVLTTDPDRPPAVAASAAGAAGGDRLETLFAAQARVRGDRPAVISPDRTLTYAELAARASALAGRLRAITVGRGQRVAVVMEKGWEQVVAVLAVLEAGATYLPVEAALPAARRWALMAQAGASVALTQEKLADAPGWPEGVAVLAVGGAEASGPPAPAVERRRPDDLAYVIYTSGSTGVPKGVMIDHRAALNTIGDVNRRFRVGDADRVLAVSALGFDLSVYDLFGLLAVGGAVVVPPAQASPDPAMWAELLARHRVTIWDSVPALFELLLEHLAQQRRRLPESLRLVLLSGDWIPVGLPARARSLGSQLELVSLGGATEAAIWSVLYPIGEVDASWPSIPYGRPLANQRLHVLDERLAERPVWAAGELYIAGAGLARGYLNDEERTAAAFVVHPRTGERMYRTGDLARRLPDGELEFLGRDDTQVKIQGFRIELGEIESVLARHPAVTACAVAAPGERERRRLLAYVVWRPESGAVDAGELRGFLRERLPSYMVPAVYVPLAALPLTANGKVDRRALPDPDTQRTAGGERPVAASAIQELLAEIWAAVLEREQVGPEESFFELGGQSLLATRVLGRVRDVFGVEVPLRSLFESPTVAALAAAVEAARGAGSRPSGPRLESLVHGSEVPLSYAQERLWFLDRLEPDSAAYVMPFALRLAGRLAVAALGRSLDEVIGRHDALRTAVVAGEEGPAGRVAPPSPFALPLADLAALAAPARGGERSRILAQAASRPFDLSRAPLLRAVLVRSQADEHALLISLHHTVTDGWSMAVLLRELTAAYAALAVGRPPNLPTLPIQYADYALWQRRWLAAGALDHQLAYWQERLSGFDGVLELPTDRPRPAVQTSAGASLSQPLPEALLRRLQEMSREQGVTLFMTLTGLFQVLLARTSGQLDVAVGTPIAGRQQVETEGLIGLFVNTLVLRTSLTGDPPLTRLLGQVRDTALDAYTHQDLPFERLVEELRPQRDLSRTPLVQVMFELRQAPLGALVAPELRLEPLPIGAFAAQFELSLTVGEVGGAWGVGAEYNRDLFDATTIRRLLRQFELLLGGVAADPHARLSELPLLGDGERHQLQVEWNDRRSPALGGASWAALFAAQAARTPAAVAAACEGQSLSYAELAARAAALAGQLQAWGVGRGALVALLAERGLDFMTAMLAVLAAGAAYLPLDPAQPPDRMARVLTKAGPPLVLVEPALGGLLAEAVGTLPAGRRPRCQPLAGAAPATPPAAVSAASRSGSADGGDLAYVIFTSGSTGLPKGAMVEQRGMLNHLAAKIEQLGLTAADCVAQNASQCFDVSVWQFLAALVVGGRVEIVREETARDPVRLFAAVEQTGVTVFETVPSLLRCWLDEVEHGGREAPRLGSLRWLIATGEALAPELARQWFGRYPRIPLLNAYGPTECSDDVSHHVLRRAPAGSCWRLPIGRPVDNTRLYVLGPRLESLPLAVPGQLYVGGRGVGRGYLGEAAQTAAVFVPDPWSEQPGGRLYATGDRALHLADGALCFLGRLDQQLKLRGWRIEPGEIEAALLRHPAVGQAVVDVVAGPAAGVRLVAWWVGAAGAEEVSAAELRRFLGGLLPEAMLPAVYLRLDTLPRLPSGKIDRRRLPPPTGTDAGPRATAAGGRPRTHAEELVGQIWGELLARERIGVEDDFFALGGHSLLATRVISRVRATFGVELPLRALFQAPVLGEFAARVSAAQRREAGAAAPPPIGRVSRGGELPLSFPQQRLWFLDQLEPGTPTYNIPLATRLVGTLRVAALAAALAEIVRRHEVLRTSFPAVDGRPVQRITASAAPALPVVDLSGLGPHGREAEARRLARQQAGRPFDLARGPLLRATLVALAAAEHLVLATLHHIVCDGWSEDVLLGELGVLYEAALHGRPSPLPELAVQYADFASWQRLALSDEVLEDHLAYWRERLAGSPAVLELPTDRPRPPVLAWRGAWQRSALPHGSVGGLERVARRQGATLFMVLAAGFQALLGRWSGQLDVAVGTPVANRTRPELEGLIGFFVNTLVLRVRVEGSLGFLQLLGRVRETALGAYAHQDLPFERLVEELSPGRNLGQTPLFQVLMVLQEGSGVLQLPGLTLTGMEVETASAKFDLTLELSRDGDELSMALEYRRDLFDGTTALRLLGHLERLLREVVEQPERCLGELPLLSAPERQALLGEWNDTAREERGPDRLDRLISRQATRRPRAVALLHGEERLTYGELEAAAERLARRLGRLGVGPETLVAVLLEPGIELVVALVAVLKAGGAYLPLDVTHPAERTGYVLQDAGVAVVLTRRSLAVLLPAALAAAVVVLDDDGPGAARVPPRRRARQTAADGDQLAYVIYTSGSTGRPKGVEITHRSLVNFLRSMQRRPGLDAGDTLVACTTVAFDIAALEIFLPLMVGARVVVVDRATATDGRQLSRVLAAHRATVMQATPATWTLLLDAGWDGDQGLRAFCGGEALPRPLAERLLAGCAELWNLYGPTETTVWSAVARVAAAAARAPGTAGARPVAIGGPVANTELYVLDAALRPVPVRVAGELAIGGAGLARGYRGRPELTAERFVPDPWSGRPGARLYRTGDEVRRWADGTLEFCGRLDHQIKLRGHRIELGEIEAALRAHPEIGAAVTVVREDAPGDRRIVAYVVPAGTAAVPSPAWLREHLRQTLPDYMVPAAIVTLAALPLTANGKLDRRALPAPDRRSAPAATFTALRNETEELLASVWSAVLGQQPIAADDDFFERGGHSLLAVQLVARVREVFGVELPLPRVFASPRLDQQAREIASATTTAAPPLRPGMARRGEPEGLPLSLAQQGLWFLSQLDPASASYNLTYAVELVGELDRPSLYGALQALVDRHEPLRTTFATVDGRACQRVAPRLTPATPLVDLASLPTASREQLPHRLAREEARRPFDLALGPVLRFTLLRLAATSHLALLSLHHIVADGWSMGVLLRDLAAFYRAAVTASAPRLPGLPIQYADYAVWQRQALSGAALAAELDFWRHRLAGAPRLLELPTDRPRSGPSGARGAHAPFALGVPLTRELRTLRGHAGATLFMILLAGFKGLLQRYTGQTDLVVGAVMANRQRLETEELIGLFANTLVLRTDASGNPSFGQLLARVRQSALAAYAHAELPFERLVDELRPQRDLHYSPVVQVVVVLQNAPPRVVGVPGLELVPREVHSGTAKFDLNLSLDESAEEVAGSLEYDRQLFDAATAKRLLGHLAHLLAAGVADPETPLCDLALLAAPERHQLRVEWGLPDEPGPAEPGCLHRLFERQAARDPAAPAVAYERQRLTYGELEAAANRLAHYLRRLGIGPGSLVGLCLERSLDLPVAVLAVLAAGAAYVPLDPAYPAERLSFLLADARIPVVVTREDLRRRLPVAAARLVCLDTEAAVIAALPAAPLRVAVPAAAPAYVIYTSGSTGSPKGCVVSHANVARLFEASADLGFGPGDTWTLFHSFAFDFSVWELWGALLHGGRLVVVPYWVSRAPTAFRELLARERVTVLNQTPSAFRQLIAAEEMGASGGRLRLRLVIFGGESLDLAGLAPWFARHGDVEPLLVNMYGITETTVHVTRRTLAASDLAAGPRSPIGRPLPGVGIDLVDGVLAPVPIGVTGEIVVRGTGLAMGYLGRPELTAERFCPDPCGRPPGARVYRSGDLARRRPDGEFDYLGRRDQQVKVRGFRVEPGEIEAALIGHPQVREAAVLARRQGRDAARLVAYLVAAPGGPAPAGTLRSYLLDRLPDYMVPAAFVWLDALPLTAHGKLDRRALPEAVSEPVPAASGATAPRAPLERQLAAIWSEVLGIPPPGVHDSFFELGGDSILAIQVVARAHQAGLGLTPRQLFEHQTIAALASAVRQTGPPGAEPGPIRGPVPLTPIQSRFFSWRLAEPWHWNQSLLLATRQALEPWSLAAALAAIVAHHDALRLRFPTVGAVRQLCVPAGGPVPLPQVDLGAIPADRCRQAVEQAAAACQASLDLDRGPLLRAVLFAGDDRPGRLLLVVHHLVVDGVSWRILLEDLVTAYQQAAAGRPIGLPPRTTTYQRWAELLGESTGALAAEAELWAKALPGLARRLPLDDPGAANLEGDAAVVETALDSRQTRELLRAAPVAYRAGIQELLVTCLALALAGWTGSRRVLLDLEGHGRVEQGEGIDLSRTFGWFTAIYPVELDLKDATSTVAALGRVKEQLRAVPRGGIGYDQLRFAASGPAPMPVGAVQDPEVCCNYLGQLDQALTAGGPLALAAESAGADRSPRQERRYRLELDASILGGRLRMRFRYGPGHRRETIERLARSCEAALGELVELGRGPQPAAWVPADFPLARLDRRDLDQVLAGARRVEDVYPLSPAQQGLLFHALAATAGGAYIYQATFRLASELDPRALAGAWARTVARHAVLRTGFLWQGLEEPLQVVELQVAAPVARLDWRGLRGEAQERLLAELLADDRRRRFDLVRPPLARLLVIHLGAARWRLLFSCHHLIVDGWSVAILVREVVACYQSMRDGEAGALDRPQPYRSFIAWLRQQDHAAAAAHWRQALAGFTRPLPIGAPAGPDASGDCGVRRSRLPAATADALAAQARRQGLTAATLALGAWALLLAARTGRRDVLFGNVIAGRPPQLAGSERMVGMFINVVPLRVRIEPDLPLAAWLAELLQQQAQAQAYGFVPLVELRRWSEVPAGLPLFESTFAFNNYPTGVSHQAGDAAGEELQELEQTSYALDLTVAIRGDLRLRLMYDRGRFAPATIDRLASDYALLLEALAEELPRCLGDCLALLSRGEPRRPVGDQGGGRVMTTVNRFRGVVPRPVGLPTAEPVAQSELQPGQSLPLVLHPRAEQVDLAEWVEAHCESLSQQLLHHGAVLCRGFAVTAAATFERVAKALASDLFDDNGEHVRESVDGKVYTPVFFAPDKKLLWHNENSFNQSWPLKIFFCCLRPAAVGGETPIVDSREVYRCLDPEIRRRFEEKGITYMRNYGQGVGLDWRQVLSAATREQAEARCRESALEFEWLGDDRLRTRARRPAVARHPRSGEMSWFNQAQHWHVSCLDAATRESVETLFAPEDLPRNCYYGDGEPIADRDMAEILKVYAELEVVFPWQAGDILICDNLLTAHARNAYSGERQMLVAMGEMASFEEVGRLAVGGPWGDP